jgi:hypothetical protein
MLLPSFGCALNQTNIARAGTFDVDILQWANTTTVENAGGEYISRMEGGTWHLGDYWARPHVNSTFYELSAWNQTTYLNFYSTFYANYTADLSFAYFCADPADSHFYVKAWLNESNTITEVGSYFVTANNMSNGTVSFPFYIRSVTGAGTKPNFFFEHKIRCSQIAGSHFNVTIDNIRVGVDSINRHQNTSGNGTGGGYYSIYATLRNTNNTANQITNYYVGANQTCGAVTGFNTTLNYNATHGWWNALNVSSSCPTGWSNITVTSKPYSSSIEQVTNFTAYGEAGGGGAGGGNASVALSAPADGATLSSPSVTHAYVPTWYGGTVANCTLWSNANGTWFMNGTNSSALGNATTAYFYRFYVNGSYTWMVTCYYTNGSMFWSANRTFTVANTTAANGTGTTINIYNSLISMPSTTLPSRSPDVHAPGVYQAEYITTFANGSAVAYPTKAIRDMPLFSSDSTDASTYVGWGIIFGLVLCIALLAAFMKGGGGAA